MSKYLMLWKKKKEHYAQTPKTAYLTHIQVKYESDCSFLHVAMWPVVKQKARPVLSTSASHSVLSYTTGN